VSRARIPLFLLALAVAFAAAAALGRAVGPIERGRAADETSDAAAARTLRLVPARTTLTPGRPHRFSFRIVDARGRALRAGDFGHHRLDLVVVRDDLAAFAHTQPVLHGATWTTTLRLASAGAYRAFADFSSPGRRHVVAAALLAPGRWSPRPLQPAKQPVELGRYVAALDTGTFTPEREQSIVFRISQSPGRPAVLGTYLGARGRLVILRQGDLAYLRVQADDDSLEFRTTFPSTGRYRAFLQFRARGRVRTAAFTIVVTR
jgi:hypothetical protein